MKLGFEQDGKGIFGYWQEEMKNLFWNEQASLSEDVKQITLHSSPLPENLGLIPCSWLHLSPDNWLRTSPPTSKLCGVCPLCHLLCSHHRANHPLLGGLCHSTQTKLLFSHAPSTKHLPPIVSVTGSAWITTDFPFLHQEQRRKIFHISRSLGSSGSSL